MHILRNSLPAQPRGNAAVFFCLAAVLSVLLTFSCASVKKIVGEPTVSLKSVSIDSLDFEGITFAAQYTVTNPYPVGFSIKQVAADILCGQQLYTSLTTSEGLTVAKRASTTNTLLVKLPYDTILSYASADTSKKALPFTVKGNVAVDLSAIPYVGNTLNIPFTKDFDVPVFKPRLSVSDVHVQLPSAAKLKESFTKSGMGAIKAASLAASLITGRDIPQDAFKGVDMDIKLTFNINAANGGGAPWQYTVTDCAIRSSSSVIAEAKASSVGAAAIRAGSGTIPMTATLSTAHAGAFIIRLLTKKGGDPEFALKSALTFTGLPYQANIPLACTRTFPVSKVTAAQ